MPLYRISDPSENTEQGEIVELTVRAANPEKARQLTGTYLLQQGLFDDIARFADPNGGATVEPITVQGKQGVLDVTRVGEEPTPV